MSDELVNTLGFDASVEGAHARLALTGALSLRTTDQLTRHLVRLRQAGVEELDLDLQELTRLDFHGVALLLRIQHEACNEGWEITMVAPPEHLRHQLTRMGVASRLNFAAA